MNLTEKKYSKYALVREMMETPGIMKSFRPESSIPFIPAFKKKKGLFLTGEGSSRLFPAKPPACSAASRARLAGFSKFRAEPSYHARR